MLRYLFIPFGGAKNVYVTFITPLLIFCAAVSRVINIRKGIGIGPEPLINNIFHKEALERAGWKAETFVTQTYFITSDFDKIFKFPGKGIFSFLRSLFVYECIYLYFNGTLVFKNTYLDWLEPKIFRLAGVKTLLMPYGGDVQDLRYTLNLKLKNAMTKDYPLHRIQSKSISSQIDAWQNGADFVISGCDWVDYMTHWDKLMLAHFSINVDSIEPKYYQLSDRPIKIIHAPNHTNLKGTEYFKKVVNELRTEGYNLELEFIQRLPNSEVRKKIYSSDIVFDQLIIGWYAMTALEAMSFGKPVFCYLRDDLLDLYESEELIENDEIPIINANYKNLKTKLKKLLDNKEQIEILGRLGREFVQKHHSIDKISKVFDEINQTIGLKK